jgi:hypothetical protein
MSRVGFKATNANGKGCKVAGKLISSTGDTIASFESNPLGMGSFSFIPQNNISYHVVLLSPKAVLKENSFPSVMQMGYVLTIANYNDSTIIISVNTNEKTLKKYPEQKLTLTSEFRGKQLITATIKLKSTYGHYLLEKDKLPIGIVRFTIHDNQKRPWCERLYYIDKKDNVIVNVSSDKESYSPHEKVNLIITVKDSTNKPVQANLSISATDAYLSGNKMQSENDIFSYFMLESDIHGYVEQPSHYFDTVNPNRYIDLDLLLLTQGWRDFIWKHFTDTIIPLKYPNETGISISGELYTLLTHKPKANTAVSLGLKNEGKAIFDHSTTDSLGRYKFENLDFTDTCNVTVSAFKNKNKAVGEITINDIFSEPMEVNAYNLQANYSLNETLSKVETEELIKHFYLTESGLPTIAIEEVDVIEEKVIKNDYLNPYYTEPDWSHQVTVTDYNYQSVFEYLYGRVAGLNIRQDSATGGYIILIRGDEALVLLDGMETDPIMLGSVPMSIIDKIDVIKQGLGRKSAGGIVSVYTKRGENAPPPKIYNSINKTVMGFYNARVFYAPTYESPNNEDAKPDIRSTVFWQPNIVTDTVGNVTVSYFNDDKRKYVTIIVEGIADRNIPIVVRASYMVE